MYDAAVIGTGPAGMSAVINLKLHNKNIIWFGDKELSGKVEKSEVIANYPGMGLIGGKELNMKMNAHIKEMGLEISDSKVTNISKRKNWFMLLAANEMYEARTVLLATGVVPAVGISGEAELLGCGVSYCATCDGFLYKGKTIAVICASQKYEHEVEYLAGIAAKVYLHVPYKNCGVKAENVEMLTSPVKKIQGEARVSGIETADGAVFDADGVFILRNAVAPGVLLPSLEMDGAHVVVDRRQATNIEGCFAAGDCTGRPYQIAKAVGEGNVAAHSMLEYLAKASE